MVTLTLMPNDAERLGRLIASLEEGRGTQRAGREIRTLLYGLQSRGQRCSECSEKPATQVARHVGPGGAWNYEFYCDGCWK